MLQLRDLPAYWDCPTIFEKPPTQLVTLLPNSLCNTWFKSLEVSKSILVASAINELLRDASATGGREWQYSEDQALTGSKEKHPWWNGWSNEFRILLNLLSIIGLCDCSIKLWKTTKQQNGKHVGLARTAFLRIKQLWRFLHPTYCT